MSGATLDPAEFEAHVARVKAAWRTQAKSMTWEEKIAAIVRMRERDQALQRSREAIRRGITGSNDEAS